MYEQEKPLFQANAKALLPDAGTIIGATLAYDDATDSWIAASTTNQSTWTGITRTGTSASPAGNISRLAAGGGARLQARTTTTPGVDVTLPAYGLREELVNRAEAAARLSQTLVPFEFVGGFTATTSTTGAAATTLTSVAGLVYPTSPIGAVITGSGIPAGTFITGVSGTTFYISKPATAAASGVSISFTDFTLPVGYETEAVFSAGALLRDLATGANFTKRFDGYKETIRFNTAPAHTAHVQIQAARSLS
jgi:hypothetical protein